MPAAELPVIAALLEPAHYLVTPAYAGPVRGFADALRTALDRGAQRIQLRMPGLDRDDLREHAHLARDLREDFGASLQIGRAQSELPSLMRITESVFFLEKKKNTTIGK